MERVGRKEKEEEEEEEDRVIMEANGSIEKMDLWRVIVIIGDAVTLRVGPSFCFKLNPRG